MGAAFHAEHLNEHLPDGSCSCGEHHSHVQVQLTQTVIGLIFILNSFVVERLFAVDSNAVDINMGG